MQATSNGSNCIWSNALEIPLLLFSYNNTYIYIYVSWNESLINKISTEIVKFVAHQTWFTNNYRLFQGITWNICMFAVVPALIVKIRLFIGYMPKKAKKKQTKNKIRRISGFYFKIPLFLLATKVNTFVRMILYRVNTMNLPSL